MDDYDVFGCEDYEDVEDYYGNDSYDDNDQFCK